MRGGDRVKKKAATSVRYFPQLTASNFGRRAKTSVVLGPRIRTLAQFVIIGDLGQPTTRRKIRGAADSLVPFCAAAAMPQSGSYDLAIVGAGICGLAHALAAARRGKRVIVIDRDAQANGASVRNFGFVTVTGQQGGDCWRRAMRSRDIWIEIATAARIPIVQRGLVMIARRREARAVLEEFLATEMGAECRLVAPDELTEFGSDLRAQKFAGALYSPHEVESRSRATRSRSWPPTSPSGTASPSCG